MTKLLKVTAKSTASLMLFSAIGIVALAAFFDPSLQTIFCAAVTSFFCGMMHEAIWN